MNKMILKIDGMMCGMCENHINDCLRREFKLKKVTSSRKKGETVLLCEEMPDEAALKRTIEQTGYTLTAVYAQE